MEDNSYEFDAERVLANSPRVLYTLFSLVGSQLGSMHKTRSSLVLPNIPLIAKHSSYYVYKTSII
jgi:hypothetical protein